MSNDWSKAKKKVEEFEEMMENIKDYLPETFSFVDSNSEWECQKNNHTEIPK